MSSFAQGLTNFVTRQVESVREMTAPVLRESKFVERGVLTPDEFVKAGDLLVYKCPTWEWCGGRDIACSRRGFHHQNAQDPTTLSREQRLESGGRGTTYNVHCSLRIL